MMRYSRSRGYNTVMKSNRYRPILIILLVLLAAFLLFKAAGVGGLDEANFVEQRNSKLRSEVQQAVSCVNSLSRLGSSSTSGMLGKIRQYVHGVEVINDLNVSMYGEVGRLYSQATFDSIYAIIETYEARLSSGQSVNTSLTELSEAVNDLSARTYALLNVDGTEGNQE
ncbi:MAG: hypothetical protein PUD16_11660 [bacterium]|nr:hypothetical protein [bacterium]